MKKIDDFFRFLSKQIKGYNKDRGNSLRFRNYYTSVKEDKRSHIAKIFDYCIWRIVTFFIIFLYIYLNTSRLFLSIILATVSFTIIHGLAITGRKRKFNSMKNQKRRHIASQRVYSEIMNKTVYEMKDYIEGLFSSMGFKDFNLEQSHERSIVLSTMYKEEKIMILFNMYKNDFDVELKEVKEFNNMIVENKAKKGILITTSDFTNDSYNHIDKDSSILLINKDKLLRIIEDNGLFPNAEEIDEMIENKISKKEKIWAKYKQSALSKNNIKKYIVLSSYLAIAAWYTQYTVYYMIISSFILALTLINFLFNIFRKNTIEEKQETNLEELLNDM